MSIWDKEFKNIREELASGSPTPGGGSAAMMSAALGASLFSMAIEVSLKKDPANVPLEEFLKRVKDLVQELSLLADKDIEAYGGFVAARALPKNTEEESSLRSAALEKSLEVSARVPLEGAKYIREALHIGKDLKNLVAESILSDIIAGEAILRGAFRAAMATFEANLPYMKNEVLKKALQNEREELISSLTEA